MYDASFLLCHLHASVLAMLFFVLKTHAACVTGGCVARQIGCFSRYIFKYNSGILNIEPPFWFV